MLTPDDFEIPLPPSFDCLQERVDAFRELMPTIDNEILASAMSAVRASEHNLKGLLWVALEVAPHSVKSVCIPPLDALRPGAGTAIEGHYGLLAAVLPGFNKVVGYNCENAASNDVLYVPKRGVMIADSKMISFQGLTEFVHHRVVSVQLSRGNIWQRLNVQLHVQIHPPDSQPHEGILQGELIAPQKKVRWTELENMPLAATELSYLTTSLDLRAQDYEKEITRLGQIRGEIERHVETWHNVTMTLRQVLASKAAKLGLDE